MLVSDLLHSCANASVVEAAIISIGGDFETRMRVEAEARDVRLGDLAASLVRCFVRDAGERDWRALVGAVQHQDFPVLAGLQLVLSEAVGAQPRAGRVGTPAMATFARQGRPATAAVRAF